MTLNLQNIKAARNKLDAVNVETFINTQNSFRQFVKEIDVENFRHLHDVKVSFEHPVTVISGSNKVGKTSLLLLLACSHEQFQKLDATTPQPSIREHIWRDVLSFTSHELATADYVYRLQWRVGPVIKNGEGKRLASSKAWSGLAKKSSDPKRTNSKIKGREVRLSDLERVLPGRSFTNSLLKKASSAPKVRLNPDIEHAFAFIFGLVNVEIYQIGGHINKSAFFIKSASGEYSTFNSATGEESIIYLLKDIIESPEQSLILVDEIESGFHPAIQRKIADVITYVSWMAKKQFIITTHSPTFLSSFPARSRKFIERNGNDFRVISNISVQAALSKMDSVGYPMVRLFCEDDIAEYLIRKAVVRISAQHPQFDRLVEIIQSGPANEVINDYTRHKRNMGSFVNKIGCCAVLDGDKKDDPEFSNYFNNQNEMVHFLFPYAAPEKFLVKSYLDVHPNQELQADLQHSDHHVLFDQMVALGLATDESDARASCYEAFASSTEFSKFASELGAFLISTVKHYSELPDA